MKLSTVLLGAFSIAVVMLAGSFWRELRAERTRSSSLSFQLREAAKRLELLESRVPVSSAVANPVALRSDDQETAAVVRPVKSEANLKVLAPQPAWRAVLPQSYPDLMEELGLTTKQLQELFDLLAKQQADLLNVHETLRTVDQADGSRTLAELEQRQKADLMAMLGATYPKFEEYKTTQPARQQVANIRRMLEAEGMPLRDDQLRMLKQTLIGEYMRLKQGEEALGTGAGAYLSQNPEDYSRNLFDLRADRDRRVISAASAYLTETQMQSVQSLLESNTSRSRANFSRPPQRSSPN